VCVCVIAFFFYCDTKAVIVKEVLMTSFHRNFHGNPGMTFLLI